MSKKSNQEAETKMRSFRLSEEVIKRLNELNEESNENKTDIIERAINRLYQTSLAEKVWKFGSADEIDLLLSDFPQESTYENPNHEGSVVAIGSVAPTITYANEGKKLNIHMHEYHTEFDRNLLLVGGPRRNNFTDYFLKETELVNECSFIEWKLRFGEEEYEAKTDEENHIQQDYGLILKAPNPLKTENVVMIVAGCRAFGTGGAASLISNRNTIQTIIEDLGKDNCKAFKILVSVSVRNDIIVKTDIMEIKPIMQ